SAHLNELTRNQAVSLGALNAISRALSATRDEYGVVVALRNTLGPILPIDELELAVLNREGHGWSRLLRLVEGRLHDTELTPTSPQFAAMQRVLRSDRSILLTSSPTSDE